MNGGMETDSEKKTTSNCKIIFDPYIGKYLYTNLVNKLKISQSVSKNQKIMNGGMETDSEIKTPPFVKLYLIIILVNICTQI